MDGGLAGLWRDSVKSYTGFDCHLGVEEWPCIGTGWHLTGVPLFQCSPPPDHGAPDTASGSSPATLGCSDTTTSSPGVGPPDVESVPSMVDYIRPAHLRDFVCPLEEARDFERGGVV